MAMKGHSTFPRVPELRAHHQIQFWVKSSVKYSLANNIRQGKNPTVPSQSDAPEESDLWTAWQLFPLDDDQTCHSKDTEGDTSQWHVIGRNRVGELGWQYGTRWRSHRAATKWCTRREWPVIVMTITHAIPKTAEVTHPDRQISEEIAGAWRRVHISAWEFQGNIRPTNWTGDSEKIPVFTKAGPVVALCALSKPLSTYIEEFKPHRRTILIPLLTAPTSHKRPSRK